MRFKIIHNPVTESSDLFVRNGQVLTQSHSFWDPGGRIKAALVVRGGFIVVADLWLYASVSTEDMLFTYSIHT